MWAQLIVITEYLLPDGEFILRRLGVNMSQFNYTAGQ